MMSWFSCAFLKALRKTGLLTTDPRLRDCINQIRQVKQDANGPVIMDQKLFKKLVVLSFEWRDSKQGTKLVDLVDLLHSPAPKKR